MSPKPHSIVGGAQRAIEPSQSAEVDSTQTLALVEHTQPIDRLLTSLFNSPSWCTNSQSRQVNRTIALHGQADLDLILRLYRHHQQRGSQERWHLLLIEPEPMNRSKATELCEHHWRKLGFPGTPLDIESSHAMSPAIGEYAQTIVQLLAQWPLILPGMQRVDLTQGHFSLTMLYAPADGAWRQIVGHINAYIFLPHPLSVDLNSRLWQEALRLSAPSASAIFSATQSVDVEGLIADADLQIEQTWRQQNLLMVQWHSQKPAVTMPYEKGRQACVIGAGLAGAGVAYGLAMRGWQVTVIDPALAQSTAARHHGHAAAAMTPLITLDDSHKARLSRAGVLRAHRRWADMPEAVGLNPCGTLELNRDKGHAKDLLEAVAALHLPEQWVRSVTPEQASAIAATMIEREGVYFPYGMQVAPDRLIQTLLSHERIQTIVDRVVRIERQAESPSYTLLNEQGDCIANTVQVIVAAALDSKAILAASGFDQKTLKSGESVSALTKLDSLHAIGGEIMRVPATELAGGPHCIVAGQGYYLPAQTDGYCVLGSTYAHDRIDPPISIEGQQTILNKIPLRLNLDLDQLRQSGRLIGWSGTRAVIQGRLPIIGQLSHAPGIWLACAYASHGLTWSSLAGDLIGAQLEGEPLPIERELWRSIAPK